MLARSELRHGGRARRNAPHPVRRVARPVAQPDAERPHRQARTPLASCAGGGDRRRRLGAVRNHEPAGAEVVAHRRFGAECDAESATTATWGAPSGSSTRSACPAGAETTLCARAQTSHRSRPSTMWTSGRRSNVGRGRRGRPAREKRRAAHWLNGLLREHLRVHILPRALAEADGDVDTVLVEVDVTVRRRDAHLDLGPALAKPLEERDQPGHGERRHACDGEASSLVTPEHRRRAADDLVERRRRGVTADGMAESTQLRVLQLHALHQAVSPLTLRGVGMGMDKESTIGPASSAGAIGTRRPTRPWSAGGSKGERR